MDENDSTTGEESAPYHDPNERFLDIMHALARLKHVVNYTQSQIKGLRQELGRRNTHDYKRRHTKEKLLASMEAAWSILMDEQVMLEDELVDIIGADFKSYIPEFYRRDFGIQDFDDDLPNGTVRLGSKANIMPPQLPPDLLDDNPPF